MEERCIRLRYATRCAHCGVAVAVGQHGWWDSGIKSMRCEACGPAHLSDTPEPVSRVVVAGSASGVAGGSARAEYERRRQRRDEAVLERHPRLGRLLLAVRQEPQSTRAWAQGAIGEQRVGAHLDRLVPADAVVLHDRRVGGTRANIDHIVVTRAGVWVVDTKRYHGRVERRDCGGWFRSDMRLYVGGRDRTKLTASMTKQVGAVRHALRRVDIPVRPVLCFTDADWPVFAKPFYVDGVIVTWPTALTEAIEHAPDCGVVASDVAERITAHLPPAN